MSQALKWYAVYTRAKWEKKVADRLARRGIEYYCPLNKVYRRWWDRQKLIEQPLFTSYVFVHVTEQDCLRVKQTDGIINIVHWLGKPAVIKDNEIDAIKSFLNKYSDVQLERISVNLNDRVRIISGPLMAKEGNVVAVMKNTVKIMLPSLGFTLIAKVRCTDIEKVFVPTDDIVLNPLKQ